MTDRPDVKPAEGKLGILLPGLGAVSTTMIAGVMGVRKGIAHPIGSLTQMQTIRLGKRTDADTPLIKDFVPITPLDDLVFGSWDPVDANAYESALNASKPRRWRLWASSRPGWRTISTTCWR